jgi:quercetin dioxygenase-like cupin family protein
VINLNQASDLRRTETPTGVMTTFASPTQGSEHLALWRVEMEAGAQGPLHVMDSEQIWTAISGSVTIAVVDGGQVRLSPGDAAVMAPGGERQVTADEDAVLIVCGHGDAIAAVPGEEKPRGVPPWIA